jgi:hypothetical protein
VPCASGWRCSSFLYSALQEPRFTFHARGTKISLLSHQPCLLHSVSNPLPSAHLSLIYSATLWPQLGGLLYFCIASLFSGQNKKLLQYTQPEVQPQSNNTRGHYAASRKVADSRPDEVNEQAVKASKVVRCWDPILFRQSTHRWR